MTERGHPVRLRAQREYSLARLFQVSERAWPAGGQDVRDPAEGRDLMIAPGSVTTAPVLLIPFAKQRTLRNGVD